MATTKKPAKKAVKKTAKKEVKKPAKKVAKKPVKKAVTKSAKKPAKKSAAKKTQAKAAKSVAKEVAVVAAPTVSTPNNFDQNVAKLNAWAKKTFNQLFNINQDDTAKQNLAAVDPTFRAIINNSNKVMLSWVSVGKIVEDGKATTPTRKWLVLWSNGDLGYVNRGTTRTPENAVSASGKNVKPLVNTNAFVKSISFEGYKMLLHGVSNKVIEVALDPKAKPNLEAAKKFATKVKKFI